MQASNIRVVKFLIYESRGYVPQFRRAYDITPDGVTLAALEERIIATDRVTTDSMIGLAHSFLTPNSEVDDLNPIRIVNGWDAPRCRFYLEVDFDFGGLGSSVRECFMGYTDMSASDGMSLQSQLIDPNMRFYMNSVSHLKNQVVPTLEGRQNFFSVIDTSQILTNHNYHGARQSNEQLYRMRPDDLFAAMTTTHLELGNNHDQRTVMDIKAVKASRGSTIAPAYMARILDSYLAASVEGSEMSQDAPDVLDKARQRSYQVQSSATDPFMRAVAVAENGGSYIQDSFSYDTLCRIDPNADNIAEVNLLGNVQHDSLAGNAMDSQNWGENGIYQQFASILSQAVPTLMMEAGLREIWFQSTNKKMDGQISSNVMRIQSFSDLFSLQLQGDEFVNRLNREVLQDLSFNNQLPFMLEMQMSMHGECVINLALNEQNHYERFVAPLFADSLMSPIVTNNQNRMGKLAKGFGELAGSLAANNLLGSALNNNIQIGSAGMAF